MNRRFKLAALVGLLAAAPAAGQGSDTVAVPVRTQAISILPLHAMFGFYAGDYERVVGPTVTAGIGASYFSLGGGGEDIEFGYSSIEAKARYYPSGDPLRGLSFGLTAGPTFLAGEDDFEGGRSESITAMGVGFEIARSHILGVDRRFFYGYGGGLKRLFVVSGEETDATTTMPTARLSVGYAF